MERIKNLSRTQKVLMSIIVAMIIAFSIIYPIIMSIKGIEFRGDFLTLKEEQGNVTYTDGHTSITVYDDQSIEFKCYHRFTGDGYRDVTYGPYSWMEEVFFRGAVSKDGYMVYNADGTMTNDFDVVLGDYYANPPDIYEIVKFINGPQTTNRGNIVLYIFGIIICIIAVVSMLFPDELFRLAMWPRVRNLYDVEPSDWELTVRVIEWYVLTIGAFVVFVIGLTMGSVT